ncbi:MAG: type II toxin-antitoxin system VapC family toxin [Desulfovibrionaceae bacterium]
MNLVDSCGWLEYAASGPNADFFAPALADLRALVVPTVCLYEVYKRMTQLEGEAAARTVAAFMHQGRVVALDAPVALLGARLSLAYRLPMADSLILATARAHEAVLWTQDAHFRGVDGVRFVERAEG